MTHKECKSKYAIDGCFSALSSSKTARKLIFSFKNRPYLIDLKKVLSNLFYEGIIQKEELIKELQKGKWVIVPVPLLETKLRKRGYNQAEILAKELGKRLNLPVENFLKRKANDKNEFEIIFYTKDVGLNILIVDDLVKTGSTLLECAKVLKRIGAKKAIGVTLIRN
ncbi:hypothetical protein M1349_05620 [Patescibacteria group bacterium]|nr:hypothetical protein [Patescibacteria group bacterium]